MYFPIVPVNARNPGAWTGAGSMTYYLPGAVPTLIDTGSGVDAHLDELASLIEADGGGLAQVLVTHGHRDHAGGAAAVAARWPGARIHKLPAPGDDRLGKIAWQPLERDAFVPAGTSAVWVVPTPGHAPDHVSFFEPRSGAFFSGDLVVNGGTVAILARHGGNLAAYLDSLRRVLDLQPRRIYPGHGQPIDNPAALLRSYLSHRLMRERQILDALAERAWCVADLVARIYPGLADALVPAATDSVLAHLLKLEDERQALREPGSGTDPLGLDATWLHVRSGFEV
ncbi:MAG: MBL fold metallo-hydrolase [Vicinamibacteraceae bacterium]|nr:MBL fold metallo-hydrolase [Vicinamibacteraceae bacterium]